MGKNTKAKDTVQDGMEKNQADHEMEEEPALVNNSKVIPDLDKISKEIWHLKKEIKDCTFGDDLRNDVRKDLNEFKQVINQKFAKLTTEQQLYCGKMNDVELQMEKHENWPLEGNTARMDSLGQQKNATG